MLIHDIYHRNAKLGRGLPAVASGRDSRPFKIVYATNRIEVDARAFDSIAGAVSSEEAEGSLFKYLRMPMSTACVVPPVAIVGSGDKKIPYVNFWGTILINNKGATITIGDQLSNGNKILNPLATVSLNVTGERKRQINSTEKIVQHKALVGYSIKNKSLEDAYMESAVFENRKDFVLSKDRVKEVLDKFFDQIVPMLKNYMSNLSSRGTKDRPRNLKPMTFKVFVLPTKERIDWNVVERPSDEFIDVFGNRSSVLAPNKPTFNSKFLSTDDKSFTLMCKKNEADMYDGLNLSNESYVLINLHNEDLFKLSGLEWYFGTDEDAKNRRRQLSEDASEEQKVTLSGIKRHGFYTQIRDMAEARWNDYRIMCLNRDKAKVEVLLNEHCPLAAIRDRLSEIKEDRLKDSPMSLESLIVKKKKSRKMDWNLYMESVRALLHGHKIARRRIVARLTYIVNEEMRERKHSNGYTDKLIKLFPPGLFCLEAIADGGGDKFAGLEDDEHFAYCVGQAAMHFACMRSDKNPTKDALLTRPIYDRATLRSVLSKIVFGLALRLDDPKVTPTRVKCANAISLTKEHDIPDRSARANLSYFFHAGAFSVIGGGGKGKGVEDGAGAG